MEAASASGRGAREDAGRSALRPQPPKSKVAAERISDASSQQAAASSRQRARAAAERLGGLGAQQHNSTS
eukprot:scaffold8060_cov110-Isochrysis_galbana.AAC.1